MKLFEIGKTLPREDGKRILLVRGHSLDCWRRQFLKRKQDRAWKKKWPNYCEACQGYGIAGYTPASYWQPEDWDPCEALPAVELCHRCGDWGLDEDGNGPCKHCGWDYDDGLNEFECSCYCMRDWYTPSIFDDR